METPCPHEHFQAQVNVGRLTDGDGGPVTSYCADVTIKCTQCGTRFEFIGVSAGSSFKEPRTSIDFTELRAPIRPFTDSIADGAKWEMPDKNPPQQKVN